MSHRAVEEEEEGIISTAKQGSSESETQHGHDGTDDDDLISKLPSRGTGPLFLYNNFWFRRGFLERILILQASFKARQDDIILATNPKCGSTWLKAIVFAVTRRSRHDLRSGSHPLLTRHPHQIIPTLDVEVPLDGDLSSVEALPSPRILSTHAPFSLLPACISNLGCRMVYICRDPKDVLISQWHFVNQFFGEKPDDINAAFDMFCQGASVYGPFWDHCLEYWKESIAHPDRLLFLKYEEMMAEPVQSVRKLAAFLGAPFTGEEEDGGVPEEVVRLCSFESLSGLNAGEEQVVQRGNVVVKKSAYFRKGKVGDWVNHITQEMGKRLDGIVEEKLRGSGLVF